MKMPSLLITVIATLLTIASSSKNTLQIDQYIEKIQKSQDLGIIYSNIKNILNTKQLNAKSAKAINGALIQKEQLFDPYVLEWKWCHGYSQAREELHEIVKEVRRNINFYNKASLIGKNETRVYKDLRGDNEFVLTLLYMLDREQAESGNGRDLLKPKIGQIVNSILITSDGSGGGGKKPILYYYLKFEYTNEKDLAATEYLLKGITEYPESEILWQATFSWMSATKFEYKTMLSYQFLSFGEHLPDKCKNYIKRQLLSVDDWQSAERLNFACGELNTKSQKNLMNLLLLYLLKADQLELSELPEISYMIRNIAAQDNTMDDFKKAMVAMANDLIKRIKRKANNLIKETEDHEEMKAEFDSFIIGIMEEAKISLETHKKMKSAGLKISNHKDIFQKFEVSDVETFNLFANEQGINGPTGFGKRKKRKKELIKRYRKIKDKESQKVYRPSNSNTLAKELAISTEALEKALEFYVNL